MKTLTGKKNIVRRVEAAVLEVLKNDITLRTTYRMTAAQFIAKRPEQPGVGPRNLGNAPTVEVYIHQSSREQLCDTLDMVGMAISIRASVQARQYDAYEFCAAIVTALRKHPEFNLQGEVFNTWTHDIDIEDHDSFTIGLISISAEASISESEE